jgi:hypothetical protein
MDGGKEKDRRKGPYRIAFAVCEGQGMRRSPTIVSLPLDDMLLKERKEGRKRRPEVGAEGRRERGRSGAMEAHCTDRGVWTQERRGWEERIVYIGHAGVPEAR